MVLYESQDKDLIGDSRTSSAHTTLQDETILGPDKPFLFWWKLSRTYWYNKLLMVHFVF